ncbi:hypothetical protein SHKM778_58140 [Streptomyces sp. KM77-8]|uniref:DUF5134 domain-containing protein n=1 Tax=Streptomyces haneummycinicus TaxID=3074435 RepID=A0AAT9HPM6_9ACTN
MWEPRRAAGGEALMGFGMAVMAVPAAVFTPPGWAWPALAAVFGAAGLQALWTARTGVRHLHHLIGAGAMVYMAVTMATAGQGRSPSRRGRHTPLTGALLLYFTAYVLATGVRLVPVASVTGVRGRVPAGVTGRSWRGPAGCPWGSRWWRCC